MSEESGMISDRLAARITAWATDYQGPCQHIAPQVGSVGDLRSGCAACSTAFAGWSEPRPCDVCGRMADPRGAWALPPRQTGAVLLLVRLCTTCSHDELHDPEEDRMTTTTTTTTTRDVCEYCQFGLRGGHRLPHPDPSWFHADCLRAACASTATTSLTASGVAPAVSRSMHVYALRTLFAATRTA